MYQSYVSQLIFEMELRGYSSWTIHSYSKYLSRFLNLTNKPISEIIEEDRYTLLSEKTLLFLRQYFKEYRPTDWLFYSARDKSRALHSRTAQVTFNASKKKAGIIKPTTFHSLRTSI